MIDEQTDPDILICYGWASPNRGDRSIAMGISELLKEVAGERRVEILPSSLPVDGPSNHLADENYYRTYYQYLRGKYGKLPFRKVIYALELLVLFLVPTLYARLVNDHVGQSLRRIFAANLVIYNGGHLFVSDEDTSTSWIVVHDFLTIFPALLARRTGSSYGLWAQSIGPFEGGTTFVDRLVLRGASFVHLRESDSRANLKAADVTPDHSEVVADPAFHLEYDGSAEDDPLPDYDLDEYICLTVRRSGSRRGIDIPDEVFEAYLDELAIFIDEFVDATGQDVLVVSQHGTVGYSNPGMSDSYVGQQLKDRVERGNSLQIVQEDLDIDDLKTLYTRSNGLVGSRFHSLIFAVQVGTPVIGLGSHYTGPKVSGLMTDLHLSEYCFQLERLDASELSEASEVFRDTETQPDPGGQIEELRTRAKEEMSSLLERHA